MFTRILIVVMSLFTGGCSFDWGTAFNDNKPDAAGSNTRTWCTRDQKLPLTDPEKLALKVINNSGVPQKAGKFSAVLMDSDPPFCVVAVDEKPVNREDKIARMYYRFKDAILVELSFPEYIDAFETSENIERRRLYAREVAQQVKERTVPLLPVMYESKYSYSPVGYEGGCQVMLYEKNSSFEITGKFNIDVCSDDK